MALSTAGGARRSSFKTSITKDSGEILGKLLSKDGQITREQLNEAEAILNRSSERIPIGKLLIKLGYLDEESLLKFVSRQLSVGLANMGREKIDPRLLQKLPYKVAVERFCFPLGVEGKTVRVAMLDPSNLADLEAINSILKTTVKPLVIKEADLFNAYKKYYKIDDKEYRRLLDLGNDVGNSDSSGMEDVKFDQFDDIGGLISEAAGDIEIDSSDDEIDDGDQLYNSTDAGIIKLVNGILMRAIGQGASDIHVEPFEKSFQVRYRVDGTLFRAMNLPSNIKAALVSRLKIMAGLNIAEKRKPQDGRIKLKLGKTKAIDFRVSVLPTLFGESIVLRLLDQSKLQIDLKKLGFTEAMLKQFIELIGRPQGLVLVTGPTGSGKTNTLYSAINILNKPEVKILTAEDPVEFNFAGINQVHVKPEVGLTFASALKSFLRQDPEVILVGEIRDMETAEIALKAAMTGHMVFSTLHTNDCPSTIGRLLDIGIPGYMISSALTLVLAQRLMKRICLNCKTELKSLDKQALMEEGVSKHEVDSFRAFEGRGCDKCNGTGYKGRVGIYELMEATQSVKEAITAQVPEAQLRKIAIKDGYKTLRDDALYKVRTGITTLDEALGKTVIMREALPAYLVNPDEFSFQNGDVIIKEGNTDMNFYQLIQGSLIITKAGKIIGEISQPGEYFGEMSSLLNQPRGATIKSNGKSVVKLFPGDKLRETIENYPEIAFTVIESLLKRLNDVNKRLAMVGSRS